jgi:hypothetical protein
LVNSQIGKVNVKIVVLTVMFVLRPLNVKLVLMAMKLIKVVIVFCHAWITVILVLMLHLVMFVLVKDYLILVVAHVKKLLVMVTVIGLFLWDVNVIILILNTIMALNNVCVMNKNKVILFIILNLYQNLLELLIKTLLVLNLMRLGMQTITVLDKVLKELLKKIVLVLLPVNNGLHHGINIVIVNHG